MTTTACPQPWLQAPDSIFTGYRVEVRYTGFINKGGPFDEGNYWERKLSATQRRYLRACETLARVRKITGSTYQINIAHDGGQQINGAGDLVKK